MFESNTDQANWKDRHKDAIFGFKQALKGFKEAIFYSVFAPVLLLSIITILNVKMTVFNEVITKISILGFAIAASASIVLASLSKYALKVIEKAIIVNKPIEKLDLLSDAFVKPIVVVGHGGNIVGTLCMCWIGFLAIVGKI